MAGVYIDWKQTAWNILYISSWTEDILDTKILLSRLQSFYPDLTYISNIVLSFAYSLLVWV